MSKHLTAYLHTALVYGVSISTHRDSGIQKRARFVGAGKSLTMYVPLESGHSEAPCHCLS